MGDYSHFIYKVNEGFEKGLNKAEAIESAINYCIENGILADILSKYRGEVMSSILTYTEKQYKKALKQEAFEDGYEKGCEASQEKIDELNEIINEKDKVITNTLAEKDKLTILNYYKERGYIDVNLLDVKVDTNYNEEKSRYERDITFVIQEGAQYTYTGLTINGCEVFSADELYALVKLKPGSVYNDVKFQEGLSNIAGKYYENGYMSNEFYPIPLKDTELHEISYKLSIKESVRSHVENIIIKGNTKTKDFVILREIPIESGDIFSREKIITALRNLMNLQYFSNETK